MKVAVLGGGVVGVATAWWLRQAGFDVSVIERHPEVAAETSRYGGGLISVGHARPWARPGMPLELLQGIFHEHAPLVFKPRLDPRQWRWLLASIQQSMPARAHDNFLHMVRLAEYSQQQLQRLADELDISFEQRHCGVLTIYRRQKVLEHAEYTLDRLRDLGVDRRLLSAAEVLELEPSLKQLQGTIVGGDYTGLDMVGDAHLFTEQLAQAAEKQGVRFVTQTEISRLLCREGKVCAAEVVLADGRYAQLEFDHFIIALGAHSGLLLESLDLPNRLWPVKGYSALFDLLEPQLAPSVGVYDLEQRLSYARMGQSLRISGFADFSDRNRVLNDYRCRLLTRKAAIFAPAIDTGAPVFWAGVRSVTPSGVPLVGRTKIANLYLNAGHGNLGWTMGVGAAKALAEMVAGRRPELDFPFLI